MGLLKTWGKLGRLVCQGCRQPLRVKAGRYRRRHFAHKHRMACSLGTESPGLLNARAVLYEWLVQHFPEGVSLERVVEGSNLPRPVDGWVETGSQTLAYWIIESGIKLEPRLAILDAFAALPVHVNWIMTTALLHEEARKPGSLHLTPTERAFLVHSDYDGPFEGDLLTQNGRSLHYLDAESESLITYRGLKVIHLPQWYQGHKLQSSLSDVDVSPVNGEFIHPGENEAMGRYKISRNRKEKIRREAEERVAAWQARKDTWQERQNTQTPSAPVAIPETLVYSDQQQSAVCIFCGQITTDWWSLLPTDGDYPALRRCKCRECLERGRS